MARAALPTSHQLLGAAWQLLTKRPRWMTQVIGVGVLINFVIGFTTSGEATSVYQSLWFTFYSSSLIWALRHAPGGRSRPPTLSLVYWEGSAAALKLLIILSLLAITSAPFSVGALLFSTINYLSVDNLLADVIAVAIWLVCGWLSLLLLSRLSPALIIATLPKLTPFKAINLSWQLTKGQTLTLARKLALVFIYFLLAMAVVAIGLSLTGIAVDITKLVIEVVSLGLILPLLYAYLFGLYKRLA